MNDLQCYKITKYGVVEYVSYISLSVEKRNFSRNVKEERIRKI